jgi:hypothetical protein
MKVNATEGVGSTGGRPGLPFKQLLEEARSQAATNPLMKRAPPVLTARPAVLPPPLRGAEQARARVHLEAQRLEQVRAAHDTNAHEAARSRRTGVEQERQLATERVMDLICRDLMAEPVAPPSPLRVAQPVAHSFPPVPTPTRTETGPEASHRAEQTVALIEKIEVFVKSHRPALALTLNNSLGAQVEIERLGPSEVALKLISRRGPPSPDTLSRIREELRARGLRVAALSVA